MSGHKVRAEQRDKLQRIKEAAKKKKFDILLVFMFDRIGHIADETPFVVEWFVKNGIQVWSTQEGEQRFESHTDKLINYIRFWQADGESEKTSIRTRTRLGQLVEEGHFTGGIAPYGYRLVEGTRLNRHKHRLFELEVVPEEVWVVRLIFEKYANEGYGTQRISTYLNNLGYRTRNGKPWHHASVRGIVCNPTYTGVLRCGNSRSPVLPHLQIISQELFDAAQQVRLSRNRNIEDLHIPMKCFSREELVQGQYQKKVQEANASLESAQLACENSQRNLEALKAEVLLSLHGSSHFSSKLLSEMVQQQEETHEQLCADLDNAELLQQHSQLLLQNLERQYDAALAMAEMYNRTSWEAKKMIICRTIQRVEVARDYQINVIFRPEYRGYLEIAKEEQEESD